MKFLTDLILKMGTVDRRWIFLVIALVVIVPLFYPLGLPIRATATTQHVYDTIDALPHGSKVLVSCEYGPSTKPEIHPMVLSVMRHLFKNELPTINYNKVKDFVRFDGNNTARLTNAFKELINND